MKRARGLALLAVLGLAGCGGDEPAAVRTAPAQITPVPTATAAVPSPTTQAHATATPIPTPTATTGSPNRHGEQTGEGQAGDEGGIRQPLTVIVTSTRIVALPKEVDAFIPILLRIRNVTDDDLTVVLMLADGEAAARVKVPARESREAKAEGLRPGTAELLSPALDPDATFVLKVRRSG